MKETLNLLPSEVAAVKAAKKGPLFYLIVGSCIYLAFILTMWIFNLKEYKTAKTEIESLNQKKAELQAKLAALPKPSAVKEISVEKEIFNEISRTIKWSRIISEISLFVPEDVWLTSIETSQDSGSIGFKGYALTQMAVASFIASIEKSVFFENVEIIFSQKGTKEVSFELKARIK